MAGSPLSYYANDALNVELFGAGGDGFTDDAPAIQAALNAAGPGGAVYLPARRYALRTPLTIPDGVTLRGAGRLYGVPSGNYGIGGLPLIAPVLAPQAGFSGSGVIVLDGTGGAQHGGQVIEGLTIDGSLVTSGSLRGIDAREAVAAVTIRDLLVYKVTGNGINASAVSSHPPDFWDVRTVKVSSVGGIGFHLNGLADSYFYGCEATGNTGDNWNIGNGTNSRYVGCKGENGSAWGWNVSGTFGASGYALFSACTSQGNTSGGASVSGAGTGTFYFSGCVFQEGTNTIAGTNTVKSHAWASGSFSPS